MNFELPELHRTVRETAAAFARTELAPRAQAMDEAGEVAAPVEKALADLDLHGLTLPEAKGGAELDALAYALVVEALAAGSPSVAWRFAVHAGPAAAALARTELDLGAMASGAQASFLRRGARLAPAPTSWLVVEGEGGFEVHAADAVEAEARATTGLRAAGLARLAPTGAPAATGDGAVRAWDDLGRAALCLGAARGALDAAVAYSKERKQFGRPISAFQAIQWKIADGVTELEAARLLMLRAAVTPRLEGADMAAAMAGQVAVRVCSEALQVHGGYGYTAEYPVERPLRAVRMLAQPDAARASVAARALA